MGQTLLYAGSGRTNRHQQSVCRRYHRVAACEKCPNKCTIGRRRVISFKPDETRVYTSFYEDCTAGKLTQKTNHTFVRINAILGDDDCSKRVILKYYPNQCKLRIRNQVVEHPFGTVKRWNDGYYLLVKGRVKAAAEIALSYLGYNFKRVLKLLGMGKMMAMVTA